MGPWDWVIVALVVFGAIQLLALRYSLGGEQTEPESGQGAPFMRDFDGQDGSDRRVERPTAEQGSMLCPHCGVENEAGFTYCWNCLNLLGR